MKIAEKAACFLSVLVWMCSAGYEVVFIGLQGEGAPAVEKTYDRLLREHLSVMPEVNAADYLQSQKYAKMISFQDYPVVSKSLVEALEPIANDTTLFVWGTVKEFKITPQRKMLFWVKLKGELTIVLNMYTLSNRDYAYSGDVKAVAYKSRGMAGIGSLEKLVHISALDRAELLEKLEFEAVRISGQMISELCRKALPGKKGVKDEVTAKADTSSGSANTSLISDLFDVSDVETKKIGFDSSGTMTESDSAITEPSKPDSLLSPEISQPDSAGSPADTDEVQR